MTDKHDEKAWEIRDCADMGGDLAPLIAQALRDTDKAAYERGVAEERERWFQMDSADFEQVICDLAGEHGHERCGWCDQHNRPRFACGCHATAIRKAD